MLASLSSPADLRAGGKKKGTVVFCTPTPHKPYPAYVDSIVASQPVIEAAGWNTGMCLERGNAYISVARAVLLRKAINAYADVIVFLDHDLSWPADALLKLIEAEGDVVAGTYRYKTDEEIKYMGWLEIADHAVQQRKDGAFKATHIPAGFLKLTRNAVNRFMEAYPHLIYGERCSPHIDLFNHGTIQGVWHGEDFAFSRRWTELGGDIWLLPDLDITHHKYDPDTGEMHDYPGNFWRFVREKDFKIRAIQEDNHAEAAAA